MRACQDSIRAQGYSTYYFRFINFKLSFLLLSLLLLKIIEKIIDHYLRDLNVRNIFPKSQLACMKNSFVHTALHIIKIRQCERVDRDEDSGYNVEC